MLDYSIREAVLEDADRLIELMRELARYEKLEHVFVNDLESIQRTLFGSNRCATAHVAEDGGNLIGYSVSYQTYSTFLGKAGIWLEDLFVLPEFRGQGIGKALLCNLAQSCCSNGYPRLEWSVLDWNQPAIDFYQSIGAEIKSDWKLCRLDGDRLTRLGQQ